MKHYSLAPANFSDYRDFLKDRFEQLQSQLKSFSLQACASRAKISKSLLQFLLNKKRHIGLDKLPGLARALKLTADEEYFVCLMICKGTSQSAEIKDHFERILDRVRHHYVQTSEKAPISSEGDDRSLYHNHLFMILQTFVRLDGFREDIPWLLEQLKIPNLNEQKIAATLALLEKQGFIVRDDQNRLKAKPESLWRPDPYDPNGQNVYRTAAEAMAELMQDPMKYKPSVYMSMSLAFDEDRLRDAEALMIEMHHRLSKLSEDSRNPTAVAHIGNFFLTVARLKTAKA